MRSDVLHAAYRTAAVIAALLALTLIMAAPVHAASNFIIEDYDIEMKVNEDDTYDIHETLKVHFTAQSHGIYRVIPYKTTLDRDGQKSRYYAKVTDFKMISKQPVKLEKRNNSAFYRIGDKNRYEDTDTVYEYTYTYDTRGDHLKDGDEVYYNLVGTTWEAQSIDHVSFRIEFPKDIDMSNVGIKNGNQAYVDFEAEGNTVVKGETGAGTLGGLTIRAVLPEGYFTRQAKPATAPLYILLGILCLIAIAGVVLWRKYGVDPPVVEPVEFYPPDGLSPAEIGYLRDGEVKGEHVMSTLLSLADKGCLKITEEKSRSKILKREITEYKFTKLKDPDGGVIGEKTFMNGLFSTGDTVSVKSLQNKFYKTVAKIKGMIIKKYEKKLKDKKSSDISGWLYLAALIGMVLLIPASKAASGSPFFMDGDIVGSIFILLFCVVFTFLGAALISTRINSVRHGVGGVFLIILGVISIAAGTGMALIFEVFDSEHFFPYIAGVGLVFLICVIGALCERKSDYYADILGKIKGYENFLKHAEKDRMEALAEEDPDFFYKTLAYAFSLGVTSVFAKKFADLAKEPPEWYESSSYYPGSTFNSTSMMSSLNGMMSSASSSMTSSPSSSGGGGGSFSGGGGGGGGGGGSW